MQGNNVFNMDQVVNPRITWEGCSVLLDVNDGDRLVFARLTAASKLKVGDKNISLRSLVGCPFGSSFQVDNGADGPYFSRLNEGTESSEKTECEVESRDNRSINDNNEAQTLTAEEIDAMKRHGAKGDEIIDALIANSATFGKKTAFSQEKYRIKKQKKYAPKVKLRRPSARSICEAYFKKNPARIGFLRFDTLSLLLKMANVGANSDILVIDRVGGLVAGSVAERVGGTGFVCNAYVGAPASIEIVKIFNFNSDILKRIVCVPLSELCSTESVTEQMGATCSSSSINEEPPPHSPLDDGKKPEINCSSSFSGEEIASLPSTADEEALDPEKRRKNPRAGERPTAENLNSWKSNGFSSLIIATLDMDPWCLMKETVPLLSFSAPFVIYHQYLQPLATCMRNMQMRKMAVGLQISEPWIREYQVLPSRTHPMMQMSAFGGYVLSGTCTSRC